MSFIYDEHDEQRPPHSYAFYVFWQKPTGLFCTFASDYQKRIRQIIPLEKKKYQMLLLKQLWTQWKLQYLLDLQTAHCMKNLNSQTNFKVGDVMLIERNTKNSLLWKLGKNEKALSDLNNKIHCYKLKTNSPAYASIS